MSLSPIDPLALLAAQADARARVEMEGKMVSVTPGSNGNMTAMTTDGGPISQHHTEDAQTKTLTKKDHENSATLMAHSFRVETGTCSRSSRQPTPSPTSSPGAATKIPAPASTRKQRGQCKRTNFAFTLHAILADKNCNSAITWLPSGKSFVILDRGVFTKQIMPRYLRETRFESFSRRLKRWNFKKIFLSGQSQAVYSHDLFQRDRLDLCKLMNGNGNSCTNYDISKPELSENATTDKEIAELKQLTQRAQVAVPKISLEKEVEFQSGVVPHAMSSGTQCMQNKFCYKTPNVAAAGALPPASLQARYSPQGISGLIQSRYSAAYHTPPSDNHCSYHVAEELLHIDRDIAMCEEQLAVLRHLRVLKQKQYIGKLS